MTSSSLPTGPAPREPQTEAQIEEALARAVAAALRGPTAMVRASDRRRVREATKR